MLKLWSNPISTVYFASITIFKYLNSAFLKLKKYWLMIVAILLLVFFGIILRAKSNVAKEVN